jgi:hypothetical protein
VRTGTPWPDKCNVTALASAGVGSESQLPLDFVCFHDELNDAQRPQDSLEATAADAPGATFS